MNEQDFSSHVFCSSERRGAVDAIKEAGGSFKSEQEREYEAMVSKTAHLRELRLAKEAADKKSAALTPVSRPKARHRIKK